MAYLFDHDWEQERERLASLEGLLDSFTTDCLEKIGVQSGWRCLEAGGGGGSIAQYLCHAVGPTGRVVATDLETRFLEAIAAPNLEVRRHDIRHEPLEGTFDLVHARKVLEHLNEPEPALLRLSGVVKPGGWLFLEDVDYASFLHLETRDPEFFRRAYDRYIEVMRQAGFQPFLGRQLGPRLRKLGYQNVSVEGRTSEWSAHGEHPVARFYRLTFARLREGVIKQQLLEPAEADQFLADVQDPNFRALSWIGMAAWGQKPD